MAIESARLRWPRSGLEELPAPKVRGGGPEEQHPPHPAPSKEQQLRSCRGAYRSCSTFKVRRSSPKEIPLVQGKELQLHFAGAAVKRYPTSKVRETQVRR